MHFCYEASGNPKTWCVFLQLNPSTSHGVVPFGQIQMEKRRGNHRCANFRSKKRVHIDESVELEDEAMRRLSFLLLFLVRHKNYQWKYLLRSFLFFCLLKYVSFEYIFKRKDNYTEDSIPSVSTTRYYSTSMEFTFEPRWQATCCLNHVVVFLE